MFSWEFLTTSKVMSETCLAQTCSFAEIWLIFVNFEILRFGKIVTIKIAKESLEIVEVPLKKLQRNSFWVEFWQTTCKFKNNKSFKLISLCIGLQFRNGYSIYSALGLRVHYLALGLWSSFSGKFHIISANLKQVVWYQRRIENPVKHLKAIDYFYKRLYLRCLTGLWI